MEGFDELVAALDADDQDSTSTSVRQPVALRRALKLAVGLGFADNPNDALNVTLREALEAFAQRIALEEHLVAHPEARPELHEIAAALAVLDHDPLASRPDLVRQAADEVIVVKPNADAADVLLWAASLRAHEKTRRSRRRSA
jgi:hypothetical protein